jgi:hypothetical protein
MRILNACKIITLLSLGLLLLPALIPTSPTTHVNPVMASYNPAPANNFHSPLSSAALIAVIGARPNAQSLTSLTTSSQSADPSSLRTIQQNAVRFIIDNSYFPQSETSIAIDPANPSHIVGGYNDAKFFFCPPLPADCGSSIPFSLSGFTTSTDGGKSPAKSGHLPDLNVTGNTLISWGDPSLAATVDGNFFYASIAINPFNSIFGNGIMIAKSNSNLFNPTVPCINTVEIFTNPCWKTLFIYGKTSFPAFTFEDKDRISVDRNQSSPFYGSVYIGWDHFFESGLSAAYLARCDNNLDSCTMLSGGSQPPLSGSDPFVGWTTPVIDKNGNVYVAWCNFGTFTTFGPVSCRVSSSPPGGTSFSAPHNIFSYMGSGTTLPSDTVVIGWATEQFRTAPGLISMASDLSQKSNNVYFTTTVCTLGHYDRFRPPAPVAFDNPGNCGQSAVVYSKSTDGGLSWSSPATLSKPAVNDQPFVTVDPETGAAYVVYYTTQYDPFNHRTDVVASTSVNSGFTFHQQRVTSVSNEPDSDPNMNNYLTGFGGSFTAPQYGDYFEATAIGGTLWVLFTGNYAVEAGSFQTDPFLAVQNGP